MRSLAEPDGQPGTIVKIPLNDKSIQSTLERILRERPALVSDDEYPIHCDGSDYRLKDLNEGRCPECAVEFKRAELLFKQYSLSDRKPSFRRTGAIRFSESIKPVGLAVAYIGAVALVAAMVYDCNVISPEFDMAVETSNWAKIVELHSVRRRNRLIYTGIMLIGVVCSTTYAIIADRERRRVKMKRHQLRLIVEDSWADS